MLPETIVTPLGREVEFCLVKEEVDREQVFLQCTRLRLSE